MFLFTFLEEQLQWSAMQCFQTTVSYSIWCTCPSKYTVNNRSNRPHVFLKKIFWKYAANLQENTHAEVAISIISVSVMISLARQDENWFMSYCTVGALVRSNFIEITPRHGYSPVNLLHIFRTSFLKYTSGRLLLAIISFKGSTVNLLIRKTPSVIYVIKCKAIFKHFSFYLKVSL